MASSYVDEWAGWGGVVRVNKEVIDLLPILLKKLSNGESLHIPTLASDFSIPKSTLVHNFNSVLVPLFPDDIKYDNSTKNWYSAKNFLSETLLSADELVTIKLLEIHSQKLTRRFGLSTKRLFNRFKNRASLKIFKKVRMEKITKEEEPTFALMQNAISSKNVLTCVYREKNRKIHPLKIVMLEGYWYLFLWDTKAKEIRKYHLKSIEELELTDDTFTPPKTDALNKLDNAINAYFKGDAENIDVELLVHKQVKIYLERQPLNKSQKMFREDDDYDRLTITITDEREIIPTIQQYLPFIKVLSPESLCNEIEKNIKNYTHLNLT